MPQHTRTPGQRVSLPLRPGEVWEVGRRRLAVSLGELGQHEEPPEIILVVQAGEAGGILLGEVVTTATPSSALADAVNRAMREPLLGTPRRPSILRVASTTDAELLAASPVTMGIAVAITGELVAVDAVQTHMELQLSGLSSDYRAQATRAGETLSPEGLRAFFQIARKFYREEMWDAYGDEGLFEFQLQTTAGVEKTLYGIITGHFGHETGLALYPSLDAVQQFYALSMEHEASLESDPSSVPQDSRSAQKHVEAEAFAHFLTISTLCLSYTHQRDVPPPLMAEAKEYKLPVAKAAAFPLVLRTGQGGMRVATGRELADITVALGAILDWDRRIDDTDGEDEVDITITSHVPEVPGFLSAMRVRTTLRDNPYLPDDDDDDEGNDPEWPDSFAAIFDSFFSERPHQSPAARQGTRGHHTQPVAPHVTDLLLLAKRVYTLDITLTDGPLGPPSTKKGVSRRIAILGSQTLHDLHLAIFEAFERWEPHLYAFHLGVEPDDRSQMYCYTADMAEADEGAGDPTITPLGTLALEVGRSFRYVFDMGDSWEHHIHVCAVAERRTRKSYPCVIKKVGKAPLQYTDDETES